MDVLQLNCNHAKAAQDLMLQLMMERNIPVAILAEPYRTEGAGKWSLLMMFFWDVLFVRLGCYFSPNKPLREFEYYLKSLEASVRINSHKKLVVAGDFNARSIEWGDKRTSARGKRLSEWMATNSLQLFNTGCSPTVVRPQGTSVVDTTWGTPSIAPFLSMWKVSEEMLSDHRAILFHISKLSAGRECEFILQETRWVLKQMDPEKLTTMLEFASWATMIPDMTLPPDARAADLVEKVTDICDVVMQRVRRPPNRRRVHWWTPVIAKARRSANAARRKYTRARKGKNVSKINTTRLAYVNARKEYRNKILKAQQEAWQNLLAQVNADLWGRPYRVVLQRLRPRGLGPLDTLSHQDVQEIVSTLFPAGQQNVARLAATGEATRHTPGDPWDTPYEVTRSELEPDARSLRPGFQTPRPPRRHRAGKKKRARIETLLQKRREAFERFLLGLTEPSIDTPSLSETSPSQPTTLLRDEPLAAETRTPPPGERTPSPIGSEWYEPTTPPYPALEVQRREAERPQRANAPSRPIIRSIEITRRAPTPSPLIEVIDLTYDPDTTEELETIHRPPENDTIQPQVITIERLIRVTSTEPVTNETATTEFPEEMEFV
ncbi:uncharacterized protein LOC113561791 [Ooceraea biroi]|uniref:uncharacterized protein LOC113561791 n=1 Tax=Ooceraea biroi TaxID=2015173 RepID=UPI000F07E171|nr:uncharacterized protein LOC113561791 [Ooceraea biroi]